MLSGLSPEQKEKLHLKDAANYKYLIGVRVIRINFIEYLEANLSLF